MLFYFNCPNCGNVVKADSALGGDMAECPHCDSRLMVPMDAVGPDTIVGGFHLIRKLGTGGMGDVYLADQPSLSRKVALKVLPPALTRKENFVARFEQEVRMHGQLNHPVIATAFDAGNDRDIYYLAMEFVDGTDLATHLEKNGALSEAIALSMAKEVAEGLRYAWNNKRIIHCDIKPGNIMMLKEGGVKILDLGLSKSLADMADLTQTGYMVGTPLYMSPEQADGSRNVDFHTDIYSLGSTLYHLVTGSPPFIGKTISEVITKRATTDPRPARQVNPAITLPCEKLLQRMLARNPADRFANYDQLLEAIHAVSEGKRPAPLGKHSAPAPRLAFGATGAVLLIVAVWVMLKGGGPPSGSSNSSPASRIAAVEELFDASIQRIRDAPDRIDPHLKALEILLADANAAGATHVALKAQQEISALQERRETEINSLLARLESETIARINAGEFAKALDPLVQYSGPLLLESAPRREAAAQRLSEDLNAARTKAVADHLASLRQRAFALADEDRLEEALDVAMEPGELPPELTRPTRERLASDVRERILAARAARSNADTQWREHAQQLARLCAQARFLDALAELRGLPTSPPSTIRAQAESDILTLLRAEWHVIQAFLPLQDQIITLELITGLEKVRIDHIGSSWIDAASLEKEPPITRRLTVDDLSLPEKLKRVERQFPEHASMLCASLALSSKDYPAARAFLEKSPSAFTTMIISSLPE